MDDIEYVYVVGVFEYNNFYLWDGFSATASYEEAENKLTEAYKKSSSDKRFKIYKIRVGDMRIMDVNDGLRDYALLRDIMTANDLLGSMLWYNERTEAEDAVRTTIYSELKLNKKKDTATVYFVYNVHHIYNYTKEPIIMEKIYNDLINRVEYVMKPKIQKILNERNIKLKVDFKANGTKLVKGFITKGA